MRVAAASEGGLSLTFIIGLLAALWSANGAMKAVITGLNRDDVGAMLFPRPDECRKLAGLPESVPLPEVLLRELLLRDRCCWLRGRHCLRYGKCSRESQFQTEPRSHTLSEEPGTGARWSVLQAKLLHRHQLSEAVAVV